MAGKVGEAFVEILPEVSKTFGSKVASDVEKSTGAAATKMGKSFQRVGAGLTAGVTLPIVGLGIAATKAFQESAAVAAQTDAAIKSTGGAAGVTSAHISELATSVSEYAAVDDEAIQAGENMLLTFTGIQNAAGKHNDIFDQTVKVMADYAQATGTDATAASLSLGKALNDPTKGLSKLSKQGVVFSDQQAKAIEKMQATGDVAGAQRVILKELTKEFGGSAKAFGDSAAGSSKKASIAVGNAMEDIGEAIAPLVSKIASLIATFAEWFSNLSGPWKTALMIGLGVLALIGPLLAIVGTAMTGLGAIATAFGISMAAAFWWVVLIVAIVAAVIALTVVIVKNWDTIKRVTLAVWSAIWGAVKTAWNAIKGAAVAVFNWLKRNWPTVLAIITGPIGLAVLVIVKNWDRIKSAAIAVLDWIRGAFHSIADFLRGIWRGIADFVSSVWDGIVSSIKGALNLVVDAINFFLRGVNNIASAVNKIPGVPDIPTIPEIPHLAAGAIVRRATLAVVGEAGPEAVVPLSRFHDFSEAGRAVAISGTLALSPDSTAYVRGVIDEDADERARHARTRSRMGGSSR